MKERIRLASLIPILVVIVIVMFAGGLGVIFMAISSTAADEWGVVGLGVALVVGVPVTAALLERRLDRQ